MRGRENERGKRFVYFVLQIENCVQTKTSLKSLSYDRDDVLCPPLSQMYDVLCPTKSQDKKVAV